MHSLWVYLTAAGFRREKIIRNKKLKTNQNNNAPVIDFHDPAYLALAVTVQLITVQQKRAKPLHWKDPWAVQKNSDLRFAKLTQATT